MWKKRICTIYKKNAVVRLAKEPYAILFPTSPDQRTKKPLNNEGQWCSFLVLFILQKYFLPLSLIAKINGVQGDIFYDVIKH